MAIPIDVNTPGSTRAADEAFDGLPSQVPPIGSVPASASVTNVRVIGAGDERRPIQLDQGVTVGPSSFGPINRDGDDPSSVDGPISSSLATSGGPADANQTVDITPPLTAQRSVDGGTFSPVSANTINTTQNSTVNQVFGTGVPRNVFV